MIDYEINEFGRRLGLPSLELNQNGMASLVIEGLGTVMLEKTSELGDGELLLVLSRPVEPSETASFAKLLEAVGWRRNPPFRMSAAFFRQSLILTARFEEGAVTAALLENALRVLSDEIERA